MKRIMVIGCPGSGKSTFSRELHSKTCIPLYHLDMLHWNADRTTVEKRVFLERLSNVLEKDEWIIDGNYGSTMELRMQMWRSTFYVTKGHERERAGIEGIQRDNLCITGIKKDIYKINI